MATIRETGRTSLAGDNQPSVDGGLLPTSAPLPSSTQGSTPSPEKFDADEIAFLRKKNIRRKKARAAKLARRKNRR